MKKLILLIAVAFLPLASLSLSAESGEQSIKISLKKVAPNRHVRDVSILEATYLKVVNSLQIMCPAGSGSVDVDVINCSTGETWCQSSDSAEAPVIYLLLSGTPGYYEVQLITESGDVYEGEFLIE